RDNDHGGSNRTGFVGGRFERGGETADCTCLLDIERFADSSVGAAVDQHDAACTLARRERLRTRRADITGAEDCNAGHGPVLYSTGRMGMLSGKTAIVTGGSRGIGLAIARALVTGGANVMITGMKEKPLADAARQLGPSVMAERANVRDYADVERAFAAAAA